MSKKNNKTTNIKIAIDTSFLIRLVKETDEQHDNVKSFFIEFYNKHATFYISTITLSEFLIKGTIEELPLDFLKIESFNHFQAKKAANIFNKLRDHKGNITRRALKDDVKILAQAIDKEIDYFLCADNDFESLIKRYNAEVKVINILKISHKEFFSKLF